MYKYLAALLVLLAPSLGAQVSVVWVDDDFDASTPGWQVTHFDVVQDGVDAVDSVGTVHVAAGTYAENVAVGKALSLLGEARDTVILDGGGLDSTVHLTAPGVTMSELTLQNGDLAGALLDSPDHSLSDLVVQDCPNGILLEGGATSCTIESCLFRRNGKGVHCRQDANDNRILDNEFLDGPEEGIRITYASGNIISGNTVSSPRYVGIYLYLSSSCHVIGNEVSEANYGIFAYHSESSSITDNVVQAGDNTAIFLLSSDLSTVAGNTVSGQDVRGIHVVLSDDVELIGNVLDGTQLWILLENARWATLRSNEVGARGVAFHGVAEEEWSTHTFVDNLSDGDPVHYFAGVNGQTLDLTGSVGQVILADCHFVVLHDLSIEQTGTAVELAFCSEVEVRDSAITDCTQYGIRGFQSQRLTLIRNEIESCERGIDLWGGGFEVRENEITGGVFGVYLAHYSASPMGANAVVGNVITDCTYGGLFLGGFEEAVVSRNRILGNRNDQYGLGIWMLYCDATEISANLITRCYQGILAEVSPSSDVNNNLLVGNEDLGIRLGSGSSSDGSIRGNTVLGSRRGLDFSNASLRNSIHGNCIAGNETGLFVDYMHNDDNHFLHNDLVNVENAHDESTNLWDDGYPSGGNYWHDYSGSDLDGDGIGDTPYLIPGGSNQDDYPLMSPHTGGVLFADRYTVSATAGGSIDLTLHAGVASAGRPYQFGGSATGFHPGIDMPGGLSTLPLVWDWFSPVVLTQFNSAAFQDFLGVLDASGEATARLNVPPLPPDLVGQQLFFAYAFTDTWDVASNAIVVEIRE